MIFYQKLAYNPKIVYYCGINKPKMAQKPSNITINSTDYEKNILYLDCLHVHHDHECIEQYTEKQIISKRNQHPEVCSCDK